MSREEQTVAVLIADICGSTPLFEESGNTRAIDLITDCLDNICRVVESHDGTVLRDQGGIFGDVVNIAARMQSLAKPGEIITTESVYTNLGDELRGQVRHLDPQTVKGKSEPMNIYAVFKNDTQVTFYLGEDGSQTVHPGNFGAVSEWKVTITLAFGDQSFLCRDGGPGLHIGRARSCDLTVNEPCVSRDHASLTVHRGKVLFTDKSSTGTWIVQGHGEPVPLRRDVMQLASDGVIVLGLRPSDNGPTSIRYQLGLERTDRD